MQKQIAEKITFTFLGITAFMVVLIISFLLFFIVSNGYEVITWDFLTQVSRKEGLEGGIVLSIIGTLLLVGGSALIAFPVGILSGIYMNEYAKDNWWKRFIGMMTNNLAGIPSVVFGLFGLAIFVKLFGFGPSIIAGSLTLATLILPIVIRTTEESLKQVEKDYQLASYALGASKWYTIRKVVLPAAFNNIVSGLILSIGRVAGETAPIIFTVAASYLSGFPNSVFDQVMALPFTIYYMATGHPHLESARPIAYGATLVLLIIILMLNMLARFMVHKNKLGAAIYLLSVVPVFGLPLYFLGKKHQSSWANQAGNGTLLGLLILGVIFLLTVLN